MKIGDLVKFNAPDLFSESRHAYPKFGVAVGVKEDEMTVHGRPDRYEIQWINGKKTTEHECYLKAVDVKDL